MRCRNAYLAFNAREYSFFLVPYLETLAAASKKAIGLTTTLHVHRAFWNISLPPPHDYGVKVPSFTFVEGKNRRQRLLFSFPELRYSLQNSTQKKLLTFDGLNVAVIVA